MRQAEIMMLRRGMIFDGVRARFLGSSNMKGKVPTKYHGSCSILVFRISAENPYDEQMIEAIIILLITGSIVSF